MHLSSLGSFGDMRIGEAINLQLLKTLVKRDIYCDFKSKNARAIQKYGVEIGELIPKNA